MTHSCRYDLRGLAKRALLLITDVKKTEITHTLPKPKLQCSGSLYIKKKKALVPLPFLKAHMDFLHGIFCMKL